MNWLYKGSEINEISDLPNNAFGFVYQTTHLPTNKKYIGKKSLMYNLKKKLGKKEKALWEGKGIVTGKQSRRHCLVDQKSH